MLSLCHSHAEILHGKGLRLRDKGFGLRVQGSKKQLLANAILTVDLTLTTKNLPL